MKYGDFKTRKLQIICPNPPKILNFPKKKTPKIVVIFYLKNPRSSSDHVAQEFLTC
jgi:hypothetical protein